MKTLKYFIISAVIVAGLSSCVVDRERGYGYRHHPHYHHDDHGYGRY